MVDQYPLFAPPEALAEEMGEVDRRQWSRAVRDAYYAWLMDVKDERVDLLLRYLDVSTAGSPEQILDDAGNKLAVALGGEDFSYLDENGKVRLTSRGMAMAADAGLLLATFLVEALPSQIKWVVKKKPKFDASFNLPVLTGFGRVDLEPIGGSIADALAVVRGVKSPGVLGSAAFSYWKALAEKAMEEMKDVT